MVNRISTKECHGKKNTNVHQRRQVRLLNEVIPHSRAQPSVRELARCKPGHAGILCCHMLSAIGQFMDMR